MPDKILIVDDNPHVLKLLGISLGKAGYQIFTAGNGDEGLVVANRELPDLIISDVMMPDTDGIEFCWMIRDNSQVPMVPFIFMTSLAEKDMEIRGFRAGADEYLVKPVDRKVLLEKVSALLNRVQRVKSMDTEPETDAVKGFEGNLAEFSLVEVIQLLNLNKRNGRLALLGHLDGEIIFKNGEMIAATINDATGKDAINQYVASKKGIFKFEVRDADIEPNIEGSTMNILLEALRLDDESKAKSEQE